MPEPGYLDDDSPGCVWLLLGTRLWGEKVPGSYDQRVGVNAAVGF